jgi:murein DD-endopeptidase MepM/ murein hydrolase activator NlpD
LATVLGKEKAAMAVELHDGYVLLADLDQTDDHTTEPPAEGPPSDWKPIDGFAWPAEGPLTSRYGMRVSPIDGKWRLHAGIDLGVGTGTPVRASKAGTVVRAGWDEVFGNVVVLDNGGGYQTLYAHNSRLVVLVGDEVGQGQVISYSGTTGWSTGPHLHFEIHYRGAPVDPLLMLGR